MTADTQIFSPEYISYSNKNVAVPGKDEVFALRLNPGQSVNNIYFIYQIKIGDKGELVWKDSLDVTKGNKVALFELFK